MFFKNLRIYRLPEFSLPLEVFETYLLHHRMQPCGTSEPKSAG